MAAQTSFATYPSLRGRTVLVTGGASGIGEAIVEAFTRQNARVLFLDIEDTSAEHLIARLHAEGFNPPTYFHCDLTDIPALQQTTARVLAAHPSIGVLVNNAANDVRHTLAEVTSGFWDHSIAVNLKHQFFMTQAIAPSMQAAGHGSVINLGSISWVIPSTDVPVYTTAKAAIVGLTRTLAHNLGPDNIRVNCVMPGAILTERQKKLWLTEAYKAEVLANQALKRHILPEEVARLVLFLASNDSSAITSQSYIIDAGWV